MVTFAMIHGSGDGGWYWHLVEQELRQRGHDTVAPDLPTDDESAGLSDYADTVVAAVGRRDRRGAVVRRVHRAPGRRDDAGADGGHLWDALSRAYDALGFDVAADGDEVFRCLVLARIIEPTSKLDSLRVLEEVASAHRRIRR